MKRLIALSILVLVLASAALADHPLVGTWKLTSQIGDTNFVDRIIITSASPGTRQVRGYVQGLKLIVHGYYFDDVVFLTKQHSDIYADSWYFVFQGPHEFGKHLGVREGDATLSLTEWHPMTAEKISSSTASRPGNLDAYRRQQMLKALADHAPRNVIPSSEKDALFPAWGMTWPSDDTVQ